MRIRDKIVGVINVENPETGVFDADHQQALELLAAQAAIAIENAQQFERTRALNQVVLAASSALQLDIVLHATTTSIAREFGYESVGINIVDETTGMLSGATFYAGLPRPVAHSLGTGITGRVARTRKPALVGDITIDPDYISEQAGTRSELCVPLLLGQRVIGVVNVESPQRNAFSTYDLHQMETIAQQVVNRIENARLYTQLEQTRNALAASTAVAWMGMVSAHWRHAIEGHAATICTEVNTIRAGLAQASAALPPRMDARLDTIKRMADMIMQHPITPALDGKDEAVSIQVGDIVNERLAQFRAEEEYQDIEFVVENGLAEAATVRVAPAWMTSIIDILMDNAIKAVRHVARRRITITLRRLDALVEIAIHDTGRGIPKRIQAHLLRHQVAKSQGERGMGVGLLLAQMVAQTYGGEIVLRNSTRKGTTMAVVLPIERTRKVG